MRRRRGQPLTEFTCILGADAATVRNGATEDVWVRTALTGGTSFTAFWPRAETSSNPAAPTDDLLPLAGSLLRAGYMATAGGPNKVQIIGVLIEATVAA